MCVGMISSIIRTTPAASVRSHTWAVTVGQLRFEPVSPRPGVTHTVHLVAVRDEAPKEVGSVLTVRSGHEDSFRVHGTHAFLRAASAYTAR